MLQVVTAPDLIGVGSVTFTVPGHQIWTLRTVHLDVARAVGGIPNRAYLLTVTDGTTTVVQAGANDAGTEPGTCSVTWANSSAGAIGAGPAGVVVAGMSGVIVPAGYQITASIVNPAAGDLITDQAIWCDYVNS